MLTLETHITWLTSAEHVAHKNRLSSIASLEFQTASGSNINTRTVRQELHEVGLHGRAAGHMPKITMRDVKRQL